MSRARHHQAMPRPRALTDRQIDEIVRREHEGKCDPASKYDRRVSVGTRFGHMAGAIPQTPCTTAGFLRSCDRFYAQIDRDIREYDYRLNLELGVRQFVEMERRERRHGRAMRRLVRDDIVRRGVRA